MSDKYKNYSTFLEPYFDVITTYKEFYDCKTISFICKEDGHVNTLNINSFGNKKTKVKIEEFCQECKVQKQNKEKTEKFKVEVLEKNGHIIKSVDFSTRKVSYECGNCGDINNSFTQNFDKNTTNFCLTCQNDKYRIPYTRLKDKVESHGFSLLTKENEYKNNKEKLNLLCVCGNPYMSVLSDIIRNKNCEQCKLKKYEKTCMDRYGVRNTSQDPLIFEKIFKNSHLRKQYKFPSGKIINIQGYEGKAIDDLLKELDENELYFGKDIPTINYLDKGKKHTYYPDMFIKKLNVIVEVKSDYTYLREIHKNHLKFTQVINTGYKVRIMIYTDKLEKIKDITITSVDQIIENFLD